MRLYTYKYSEDQVDKDYLECEFYSLEHCVSLDILESSLRELSLRTYHKRSFRFSNLTVLKR